MPYSDAFGKEWSKALYAAARPATVAEAGPGAGWWANTLRPLHRGVWTAVEAWEPYVAQFGLADLYDAVIVGDACDILPGLGADLTILGDVLEHIPRDRAEALVEDLIQAGSGLLVSVPIVDCPQGAVGGNPYEAHLWTPTHEGMLRLVEPDAWAVKPDDGGIGVYWRLPEAMRRCP